MLSFKDRIQFRCTVQERAGGGREGGKRDRVSVIFTTGLKQRSRLILTECSLSSALGASLCTCTTLKKHLIQSNIYFSQPNQSGATILTPYTKAHQSIFIFFFHPDRSSPSGEMGLHSSNSGFLVLLRRISNLALLLKYDQCSLMALTNCDIFFAERKSDRHL